jgi:hypothetical protein
LNRASRTSFLALKLKAEVTRLPTNLERAAAADFSCREDLRGSPFSGLRVNRPTFGLRPALGQPHNAKIIAFVATTDAAKSRAFYEGVLGLVPILEDEFAIVLDANGVELRIQKVQTLTPQPQTQLGWSVISLEEVVRALRAKGVVLESSPVIGAKCDSPATRGEGAGGVCCTS